MQTPVTINGKECSCVSVSMHPGQGNVYLQNNFFDGQNYQISSTEHPEKIIAAVLQHDQALRIACYSASYLGGYGDVYVCSTDLPVTHDGYQDWLLSC
ncbi:hypothetical protein ACQUXI_004290 [Cronobacter turicensis]